MSEIKSRLINWLYRRYLPLGMLVTLFAPKGRGKTKVADYLTSVITTGRNWDDGTPNTLGPRRVLRFNLEDPAAEVLKPSLFAAGANLDLIEYPPAHMTLTIKPDGQEVMAALDFSDPAHVKLLKQKIRTYRDAVLVIIEPITNYKGKARANQDDDMRPIYMNLAQVAAETGVCILVINHTNRRTGVDPLEKSLGAGSGPNVARMNWFLDVDPDTGDRILVNAGSNLPTGPALCFKIESHAPFVLDGDTYEDIGYAVFSHVSDITADELLGRIDASKTGPERGQRTEIKNAIRSALEKGEMPGGGMSAGDVYASLGQSVNGGFHQKSIQRAAHEMTQKGELFKESGGFGVVFWSLKPFDQADKADTP
ncbi:MAG: AAA family ATPase [Terriglobales bacterium]|jgi:hypothetical protein